MLVLALFSIETTPLFAQVRFGLTAGYNHAIMAFSEEYIDLLEFVGNEDLEPKPLPAYHVGATVEFGLGPSLGINTGVRVDARGVRQVYGGTVLNVPYTETRSVAPLYLRVPLSLTFRQRGLYLSAGPYIGYALAGKIKTKIESAGASSEGSEDIDFGNEEGNDLSPLDYGAQFELGYEFFEHLRVGLQYNLGISNTLPADVVETWDDLGAQISAKNRGFGVSLTFLY